MIPKIIHFNFGMASDFGKKTFSFIHYLAIRSAKAINPDYQINIWYAFEPKDNIWWNKSKDFCTCNKIPQLTSIYKRPLHHTAHRAGVMRLKLLKEHGGIYLDADVISVRPFLPLLDNQVVMGVQPGRGLCDATILAQPNSSFITRWLECYKTFNSKGKDKQWDYHAVVLPGKLSKEFPNEITILPHTAFFNPLWHKISKVLTEDNNYTAEAYSIHLWEQVSWDTFSRLTPQGLLSKYPNSEFVRITKPYLEELI